MEATAEASKDVLLLRFAVALLAACFGLFVSRIAWRKNFFQLPEENPIKGVPKGREVCLAFAIFFFLELIAASFLLALWTYLKKGAFVDPQTTHLSLELKSWLSLAMILSTGLALTAFYATLPKPSREAIWGSPAEIRSVKQNLRDFSLGSMTWMIVYPWIMVVGQLLSIIISFLYNGPLPDQTAVKHLKDLAEYPLLLGMTALFVVTIIPCIEELLFRGFLQSWLKTTFTRSTAIIITSVIFASFHFSIEQGIENVEFISALFLLSCFLGFLKERQNSLWASIGLHSTFNAISVGMLLV